jgi:hypothetical protein
VFEANETVRKARKKVAKLLGVTTNEIQLSLANQVLHDKFRLRKLRTDVKNVTISLVHTLKGWLRGRC